VPKKALFLVNILVCNGALKASSNALQLQLLIWNNLRYRFA